MRKLAAAVLTAAVAGGVMSLSPAAAQTTDNTAFCDAVLDAQQVFDEDEPAQADVEAALSELQSTAVAELTATVETLIGVLAAGGDPTENPAFGESLAAIGEYVFTSCGWQTAQVTMADYSFTGLPKTFTTGPVVIKTTNEGAELHELMTVRFKNKKDTLRKVLQLPERQAQKRVVQGPVTFAAPGELGYLIGEFKKAGNWAAVCFIPVGTTPDAEEGGDGPPHAIEGMAKTFKVVKA